MQPRLPMLSTRIKVLDTRTAKPAAKAANPFYLTSQWRALVAEGHFGTRREVRRPYLPFPQSRRHQALW
jgi:hypothetical protein